MSHANDLARLRHALQKRNHPAKGSSIKVEPIRDRRAIEAIKNNLALRPRNLCLFTLGINTAYRASELLSLRIGDVDHLEVGDDIDIKQLKNNKYRRATLNGISYQSLRNWLDVHPAPRSCAPLFLSQRGGALSVSYVNQLVKIWCKSARLKGNYGSHTLRKTWGYHQRITHKGNSIMPLLMRAYGHASETQTLEYLGIQPEELMNLYLEMEL